ncbi:SHOCT domain-containing protein [Streptomyces sp. NPDC007355]|uniref:SHOCT domain-containing protein n=1 Tax=Streptomyces sp. NPDC007355 TaxID=3364778 RepID=UPI003688D3B0
MPGLLRGVARTAVISGTATAVSNRVSRRQAGRWAQQEQAAAPAPQAYSAPPPAPAPAPEPVVSMDTKIAQLKELAELKEQGVLSETEFAAQKSRLLEA